MTSPGEAAKEGHQLSSTTGRPLPHIGRMNRHAKATNEGVYRQVGKKEGKETAGCRRKEGWEGILLLH